MSNQIPSVDFTTFILSLSTAAYMGLGVVPVEENSSLKVDLDMAKMNIDFLELIRQKTKGNLTEQEVQLLDQLLFELRLKFIEKQKK